MEEWLTSDGKYSTQERGSTMGEKWRELREINRLKGIEPENVGL